MKKFIFAAAFICLSMPAFAATSPTGAPAIDFDRGAAPAILPSLAFQQQAPAVSVCERTPAVRRILERLLKKPCAQISEADLAALTTLNLSGLRLVTLAAGDLQGMASLQTLDLSYNRLVNLPAGL